MNAAVALLGGELTPTVVMGAMLLLVVLVKGTRGATPPAMRLSRPGWLAKWRARAGVSHPRRGVRVGYRGAFRTMGFSDAELAGNMLAVGAPKSGKTNLFQLLVEAAAGKVPIVVLDPKASPALERTVRERGGQVWTLDGRQGADLLDPRPPVVAEQLTGDEEFSGNAAMYGPAAFERVQLAAWALALRHEPMDLRRIRALLSRDELLKALVPFSGPNNPQVREWVRRLLGEDPMDRGGALDVERVLGNLLDGVALGGSLGTGPEAIRLEDVIDTRGLVLFQLNEAEYERMTHKVAAWVLIAMARVAKRLPPDDGSGAPRALLIADEIGALGKATRHLRPLIGRAREAGLAVVVATQGLTDLRAVDGALVDQLLQDTAIQVGFRQGGPVDAELMQAVFGQHWTIDESWTDDGRATRRRVQRWRVPIEEWMNGLCQGDAWVRVAPIAGKWRQGRIRVARSVGGWEPEVETRNLARRGIGPRSLMSGRETSGQTSGADRPREPGPAAPWGSGVAALRPEPPVCPKELLAKVGAEILGRCETRWGVSHPELGACLVWTGTTHENRGEYGWKWDPELKRMDRLHRTVWRRVFGPIPPGKEVGHVCEVTLCQRPDHLKPQWGRDNIADRGATRGPRKRRKGTA